MGTGKGGEFTVHRSVKQLVQVQRFSWGVGLKGQKCLFRASFTLSWGKDHSSWEVVSSFHSTFSCGKTSTNWPGEGREGGREIKYPTLSMTPSQMKSMADTSLTSGGGERSTIPSPYLLFPIISSGGSSAWQTCRVAARLRWQQAAPQWEVPAESPLHSPEFGSSLTLARQGVVN